jgi:thiamine biosynthesis protein ThiS
MIKVCLNGEWKEVKQTISLSSLLEQYWQGPTCFAVAVNQQFIARYQYNVASLQDGDIVDLIMPMQGG